MLFGPAGDSPETPFSATGLSNVRNFHAGENNTAMLVLPEGTAAVQLQFQPDPENHPAVWLDLTGATVTGQGYVIVTLPSLPVRVNVTGGVAGTERPALLPQ